MAQLVNTMWVGGTEVQVVELLRGLGGGFHSQLALLDQDGPLLEQVRALGLRPTEFPLRGGVLRTNTGLQVLRLARWLGEQRVEVLHAHGFYAAMLALPAARLARCKVIIGRLDLGHWLGATRRAVISRLTRMADHVIANAEAIRRMLIEQESIPRERISVIPNGLDLEAFDARARAGPRAPLPPTGGAPVVALVANLNQPVKRHEDFLRAMSLARRQVPGLRAFLVGEGARRPEMERLARELGLEGAAHFLGPRMDVPAILARARLGVLCSEAEGLSNAVMEGMAAGLPMVVTDVGGNPELVAHGERGLVVPPRRPERLAEAMVELLHHPEWARRMGESARLFIRDELGLGRMVARHEALYRRVSGSG